MLKLQFFNASSNMKIAIVIALPLKVKYLTKIRSFCGHRKGATTLSIMTLSITTLDTMPFNNMTLSIIILCGAQHKDTQHNHKKALIVMNSSP